MKIVYVFLVSLLLSSCTAYRYARYNFVGIEDYKIFPSRVLQNSLNPFKFYSPKNKLVFPDTFSIEKSKLIPLQDVLIKSKTVSYLIIRNDTLLYNWQDEKYGRTTPVLSFSMAKSITSILYGCALRDGYIKSVSDKVVSYVPELSYMEGIEKLTIEHLLNMVSGIDFDENYNSPFSNVVKMYYGPSFKKVLKRLKFRSVPGEKFKYQNGDTQLLGLILQRALNGKTITDYCNDKIWEPLHMENEAMWNIFDKDKLEKTFCGIGATAIDYAKIGRLYLNRGNWNGNQLVPEAWVKDSWRYTKPVYKQRSYCYQWWGECDSQFVADGHNGQYIFTDTKKKVIIIRLGYTRDNFSWIRHFKTISEKL
jgi:CubicO group peptidase (beta-lactamase class C family)